MREGAKTLLGTHDFSAMRNANKEVRTNRYCTIQEIKISDEVEISIVGDHFLYKMVRNIVGTLVYLGLDKIQVEEVAQILSSKNRINSGICAPAHGLTLKEIYYDWQK